MMRPIPPWSYPPERYYYGWYLGSDKVEPSDHEIKSRLVDRLNTNPATADEVITVDVKKQVVILTGSVSSQLAKRSAGDDAWDTEGVNDVSNQLEIAARKSA